MAYSKSTHRTSLGDVRRLGHALQRVLELVDATRSSHLNDGVWYAAESPAALDATFSNAESHIEELLGAVNIRLSGALDLADHISVASSDATGLKPVSAYAPIICARSTLEMCATASWLVEPNLRASLRIGRILTLSRDEQTNRGKLPDTDPSGALIEIADAAEQFGLRQVGRRNWGYGEEFPTLTKRISNLMANSWVYSLLSAAAHGESPALIEFGYVDSGQQDGTGVLLQKAPPAYVLAFATHQSLIAVAKSTWLDFAYRGWETQILRTETERLLDEAGFESTSIPWDS